MRVLQAIQALAQAASQILQQLLVTAGVDRQGAAQGIQFRQFHRQACGQGFSQTRAQRRFAEYAARASLLQALAHGSDMPRTRLYLGQHAEHAGVLEAVGSLEIVEGLVENEVRLALQGGQLRRIRPSSTSRRASKAFRLAA